MKMLEPIFGADEMLYCSVPVPSINAHKDPNYTFDFTTEQIAGYGQSQTHPSIIYIPDGWNGHKYWLATTPYPHALDVFENPCIYYGDEDENGNPPRIFTPISGVISGDHIMIDNPVVKVPNNTNINSDPDLYFDAENQIMYLYSRYNNPRPMRGYLQKSIDGQSWTERDNSTYMDMPNQPSLIKVGNKVLICTPGGGDNQYTPDGGYPSEKDRALPPVWQGDIDDISSFERDGYLYLSGKISIAPYHSDFFKDSRTGKYYTICAATNYQMPSPYNRSWNFQVYLGESDDGYNYRLFARPLLGPIIGKATNYYRPTAFVRESDGELVVYWSAWGGVSTEPSLYPNGSSDVPVDGRTIGLSHGNFDAILARLNNDRVTNILD